MSAKYQLLPPLTDDEYASLFDDIAAGGVKVPIDVDEQGEILDGHHRKRVCDELGIECPTRVVELPDSAKADYALTVNLARRHLDRMQRRQLVVNSLKLDPRLGDRVHARRCGVDHKTVTAVRGDLIAVGEIPHLTEREGADGKIYPATKTSPGTAVPEDGEEDAADRGGSAASSVPPNTSGLAGASPADEPGEDSTEEEDDRPNADASSTPPKVGVPEGGAEIGTEAPPPVVASVPVDGPERATDAGVSPSPAPDLVKTPIGPMEREFAEKLDRLVPDPNPHRQWQDEFLNAVFAARKAFRKYTAAEIAEKADTQVLGEFAGLAADLEELLRATSQAQIDAANKKVRPLRSVS